MGRNHSGVGGSLLWRAVAGLSGKTEAELLTSTAPTEISARSPGAALPERPATLRLVRCRRRSSARSPPRAGQRPNRPLFARLLGSASPLEAKYIVKIMTGDLRIGLKESLVEEAIAKAYERNLAQMFSAPTCCWATSARRLKLAAAGQLAEAKMGCSIPSASCWPARPNRRRRAELFQDARSKTNTTASARRPILEWRGALLLAHPGRDHRVVSGLPDALAGIPARCNSRW